MPPSKGHKKSRTGCVNCKRRRVKCDETRPRCLNCTKHGTPLNCLYNTITTKKKSPSKELSPSESESIPQPHKQHSITITRTSSSVLPFSNTRKATDFGSNSWRFACMCGKFHPHPTYINNFPSKFPGALPPCALINIFVEVQTASLKTSTSSTSFSSSSSSSSSSSIHIDVNIDINLPTNLMAGVRFNGEFYPNLTLNDLALLQHFVNSTSDTLSHPPFQTVKSIWVDDVPKIGKTYPFVMHSVLAFSAFHRAHQLCGNNYSTVSEFIQSRWESEPLLATKVHEYILLSEHHYTQAMLGMKAELGKDGMINEDNCHALFVATTLFNMYHLGHRSSRTFSVPGHTQSKPSEGLDRTWISFFRGAFGILHQGWDWIIPSRVGKILSTTPPVTIPNPGEGFPPLSRNTELMLSRLNSLCTDYALPGAARELGADVESAAAYYVALWNLRNVWAIFEACLSLSGVEEEGLVGNEENWEDLPNCCGAETESNGLKEGTPVAKGNPDARMKSTETQKAEIVDPFDQYDRDLYKYLAAFDALTEPQPQSPGLESQTSFQTSNPETSRIKSNLESNHRSPKESASPADSSSSSNTTNDAAAMDASYRRRILRQSPVLCSVLLQFILRTPNKFWESLEKKKPRALIIYAYYVVCWDALSPKFKFKPTQGTDTCDHSNEREYFSEHWWTYGKADGDLKGIEQDILVSGYVKDGTEKSVWMNWVKGAKKVLDGVREGWWLDNEVFIDAFSSFCSSHGADLTGFGFHPDGGCGADVGSTSGNTELGALLSFRTGTNVNMPATLAAASVLHHPQHLSPPLDLSHTLFGPSQPSIFSTPDVFSPVPYVPHIYSQMQSLAGAQPHAQVYQPSHIPISTIDPQQMHLASLHQLQSTSLDSSDFINFYNYNLDFDFNAVSGQSLDSFSHYGTGMDLMKTPYTAPSGFSTSEVARHDHGYDSTMPMPMVVETNPSNNGIMPAVFPVSPYTNEVEQLHTASSEMEILIREVQALSEDVNLTVFPP